MAKPGYGRMHRLIRAALLSDVATAEANSKPLRCPHCQQPMLSAHKLDLDHTEDRTSYRGMAHARCNRADGGRKGNRVKQRRNSRKW